MSHVDNCNKHGQYKGDYCGECIDDLYAENMELKEENALLVSYINDFTNKLKNSSNKIRRMHHQRAQIRGLHRALAHWKEVAELSAKENIQLRHRIFKEDK
jgi:predicted RNase H-like nuclease (RuvC/YqgF family)